ncbi:regulator of nonsense transcripts 3A isoform X3 [Leopardus geoffroyi]|uniref:regulator of nonsense transcripts 3A isoform X3 n=1 Tax=Leopardus geoffroyi TaxID=46844 RepID=UPI001E264685|nr:regulator of nonsense transcripts 3A isoform X3 [Leopardus geoffroyi]
MRSEKEAAGGPGAAVAARGPSGREKPSAVEVQFRRESPRREPEAPPASFFVCGDGICKHREEKKTVLSKVVIRRLPPSLTKEQLEEQLHPLPAHDYFEFFTADFSLYPHLYSRAYINFRNPDDILLFRDRFDGYIFIDSKGLEYPAVVEFAPFQKIAKKKLKKKDAKTGSIEDDPEYKKFLETYCVEEEKTNANPETLLGDMEAKTRELIARRTTPLLEYIRKRKLEKQRIREEKREERRRRELEKKRLREEEKRKKRDEERCKRKEADKQKRTAEREVRIKLLKKPEKGEEPTTEKPKERGEEMDTRDGEQESCPGCAVRKPMPLGSSLEEPREKSQNESNEEQRELDRRFREKDPETQRCHLDDSRKQRAHCEFDTFSRRNEEELRWGKGGPPDRGKKGSQDSGNAVEAAERPGKEQRSEGGPAAKTERPGNKDRPALQLYQPRVRIRAREGGRGTSVECPGRNKDEAEDSAQGGSQKSEEAGFLRAAQCHPNQEKRRSVALCCQACELTNQIFHDADSKNNPMILLSQTHCASALNISERERQRRVDTGRDRPGYNRPTQSHTLSKNIT